jgi:hypothetical protein
MNSFKVRLKAWIKRMLRPVVRPVRKLAKPIYLRLRTGASAIQAHYQVGKLLPVLERTVENLRHEREQSDQLILALYQTINYPPTAGEKRVAANFAVPLGGNKLLVAHPFASFMLLDSEDLQVTPQVVMNRYEPGVGSAIRQLLRPGDVAIDLGAAPGVHTLTMATTVGNRGAVHAFVRDLHEQQWLQTNLKATGLDRVARCWLDRDVMSVLEEMGQQPRLIRVGASDDHAKLAMLLTDAPALSTVRILFAWPATKETCELAEALCALRLNFWNIDPEGTLFRTSMAEMRFRSADQECYYVAARSLEYVCCDT